MLTCTLRDLLLSRQPFVVNQIYRIIELGAYRDSTTLYKSTYLLTYCWFIESLSIHRRYEKHERMPCIYDLSIFADEQCRHICIASYVASLPRALLRYRGCHVYGIALCAISVWLSISIYIKTNISMSDNERQREIETRRVTQPYSRMRRQTLHSYTQHVKGQCFNF